MDERCLKHTGRVSNQEGYRQPLELSTARERFRIYDLQGASEQASPTKNLEERKPQV